MTNLNLNRLVLPLAVVVLALIAALSGYRLEVSPTGGLRFEPTSIVTVPRGKVARM